MTSLREAGRALRRRPLGATAGLLHRTFSGSGGSPRRRVSGFGEESESWAGAPGSDAGQADAGAPQRTLGEAVRLLRGGRAALGEVADRLRGPAPDVEVPDGAGFHTHSFACKAGARDYRLYVPSLVTRRAEGLLLMLHGCTQSPEDFAIGTDMNALAEREGLIVAYPAQTSAHSMMQCWNWFRPGDQMRGAGEPAILAGLVEHLGEVYGLAPGRVYAAGLSAGGAMAAILAETYPDLFEAVGVHSGIAPGAASDVLSAFAAMRGEFGHAGELEHDAPLPRMIVFHGGADRMVHPANAERIVRAARARLPQGEIREEEGHAPGGRAFRRLLIEGRGGVPEVESWMVDGAGHAWSGGRPGGSFTDPEGPDASKEMMRFFLREPVSRAA